MKKFLLIPMLLLLSAWSSRAQQPEMLVQYLDLSSQRHLTFFVEGEYTTVNIYQDTVDFVAIRYPLAADTAHMNESFFLTDVCNGSFATLCIMGIGRQGIFEVHTKRKDIDICVRYYNTVGLCAAKPHDTIRLNTLRVQANDFSMVSVNPMLVAQNVFLLAEDCSRITYHRYKAERYSENTKDNGVIYGGTRNGESQASKHHLLEWNTEGYDPFPLHNRKHYHAADRLHLSLIGSLLTLGESPLSGFGWARKLVTSDAYGPFQFQHTRTTPTSFQAEFSYDVVAKPRYAIGIGVGYSYSRYEFVSPYVGVEDYGSYVAPGDPNVAYGCNSCNFAHLLTPFGNEYDWTTWFTTHYVNLPISFAYYAADDHRKGFHAGLDLIPSFAIGQGTTHRQLCSWDAAGSPSGMIVNEYESVDLCHTLDARFSVGWAAWSVIFQVSNVGSFLVWKSPTKLAYPFRIGLKFNL